MSQHFPELEQERDYSLFCSKKETDVKTEHRFRHGMKEVLSSQIYTKNKVRERKQEPD